MNQHSQNYCFNTNMIIIYLSNICTCGHKSLYSTKNWLWTFGRLLLRKVKSLNVGQVWLQRQRTSEATTPTLCSFCLVKSLSKSVITTRLLSAWSMVSKISDLDYEITNEYLAQLLRNTEPSYFETFLMSNIWERPAFQLRPSYLTLQNK